MAARQWRCTASGKAGSGWDKLLGRCRSGGGSGFGQKEPQKPQVFFSAEQNSPAALHAKCNSKCNSPTRKKHPSRWERKPDRSHEMLLSNTSEPHFSTLLWDQGLAKYKRLVNVWLFPRRGRAREPDRGRRYCAWRRAELHPASRFWRLCLALRGF